MPGLVALPVSAAAASDPVEVPSGLDVRLIEVRWHRQPDLVQMRLRFLVPAIAEVPFSAVEADFPHLCHAFALPLLREDGRHADLVVISYSDRAVEFGASDPTATQFFEAFRPATTACIWEGF